MSAVGPSQSTLTTLSEGVPQRVALGEAVFPIHPDCHSLRAGQTCPRSCRLQTARPRFSSCSALRASSAGSKALPLSGPIPSGQRKRLDSLWLRGHERALGEVQVLLIAGLSISDTNQFMPVFPPLGHQIYQNCSHTFPNALTGPLWEVISKDPPWAPTSQLGL